ncbi:MAG: magnesium transporter [Synechococcaceae cyanobacterium]
MAARVVIATRLIPAAPAGPPLPLLYDRLKLDPALMSAPFIATATDVVGVFIYLHTAGWLLARLPGTAGS